MPNITYSIGGTSFDAVPEKLDIGLDLSVRSEATIGRGRLNSVGVGSELMTLSGKYMSVSTRDAIVSLYEACESTGATAVFTDGYGDRNVLIRAFETTPLIGKTEGYSFKLTLVVV